MVGRPSSHRIREQQTVSSLDMVCFLCVRQCQAIASACLQLQRDPNYEVLLGDDAFRLSSVAKRLVEESANVRGAQLLRLAVAEQLLLQIMGRREVIAWLAGAYPETLSILMNSSDLNRLADWDKLPMFMGVRRPRKKRIKRRDPRTWKRVGYPFNS